jgi:hypothetical protein
MTREQAMLIAEAAREEQAVPREAGVSSTEQRYIELGEADPEQPSPVRDVLAWLVRFQLERGRWVELAIDSKTAKVVRVQRSR